MLKRRRPTPPWQVHFLARYWSAVRGETWEGDAVADKYFPFIASPRFTLREFFTQPSRWFWFTGEWADFQATELGGVQKPGAVEEEAERTKGAKRRLTDFDP